MNELVYKEARRTCKGCQIDDLSQLKHGCMVKEEDEIWICCYDEAKKHLNVDKLWSVIERQIFLETGRHLQDSWLKYLLQLLEVDETSVFLLYEDFERKQIEDECLKIWVLWLHAITSYKHKFNFISSCFD